MNNFCTHCGKRLKPNANYCSVCGKKVKMVYDSKPVRQKYVKPKKEKFHFTEKQLMEMFTFGFYLDDD